MTWFELTPPEARRHLPKHKALVIGGRVAAVSVVLDPLATPVGMLWDDYRDLVEQARRETR